MSRNPAWRRSGQGGGRSASPGRPEPVDFFASARRWTVESDTVRGGDVNVTNASHHDGTDLRVTTVSRTADERDREQARRIKERRRQKALDRSRRKQQPRPIPPVGPPAGSSQAQGRQRAATQVPDPGRAAQEQVGRQAPTGLPQRPALPFLPAGPWRRCPWGVVGVGELDAGGVHRTDGVAAAL